MIEELFRCFVPEMFHSRFAKELAHWEWRFAMQCIMYSNERWRLPFDAESLARRADPDNILKVRVAQIADLRDRWLNPALGFFMRCTYHGDQGLEIAPQFRRDRKTEEHSPPAQMELTIPPVLVPPPKNSPPRRDKESDSETNPDPDSSAHGTAVPPSATVPFQNRGGGEPGNRRPSHTRTLAEMCATPLGRRLADYIGQPQVTEELRKSGAEWLRILRDEADWLDDVLLPLERTRSTIASGVTRAKAVTARLAERRRNAA